MRQRLYLGSKGLQREGCRAKVKPQRSRDGIFSRRAVA